MNLPTLNSNRTGVANNPRRQGQVKDLERYAEPSSGQGPDEGGPNKCSNYTIINLTISRSPITSFVFVDFSSRVTVDDHGRSYHSTK